LLKRYIHTEHEEYMEEHGDEWEDGVISMEDKRVLVALWVTLVFRGEKCGY